MRLRIGKVTNTFPEEGKVKVVYEDENNATLKLAMLTMNAEYSMPEVGEMVLTMHMENGSSKGFCLGSYYSDSNKPKTNSGYRKDFGSGAYIESENGNYVLSADVVYVDATDIIVGTESLVNLIRRLERVEDALGLTHEV